MKKLLLAVAVIVVLATLTILPIQAANLYGGHSYYLTDMLTWQGAENAALAAGGHLVTVNDLAEHTWLTNTFTKAAYGSLWIGFYQLPGSTEPGGGWVWSSGEAVTFTNWVEPGEPNNTGGNESVVAMNEHNPGGWNDLPNSVIHRGIVELAPVPEPATLLGFGIPMLMVGFGKLRGLRK